MTSHDAARTPTTMEQLPFTLDTLAALATTTLLDHGHEAGRCLCCGASWPCERAKTAAHNLALL